MDKIFNHKIWYISYHISMMKDFQQFGFFPLFFVCILDSVKNGLVYLFFLAILHRFLFYIESHEIILIVFHILFFV